jgi:mono/diheme cytochrome c family protein
VSRAMATRRILCVVVSTVLAATAVAVTRSPATASPNATAARTELVTGRQLYRKFCGQCHALAEALSAGFGSNKTSGLGKLGGPSFNELRVPYAFSITAVTEPTGGHEVVRHKITSKQLHVVARWLARATGNNPVPAYPTDG